MKPRLPAVINIIALAGFAGSLSTRALDPVLPHLAAEFSVSDAVAAGLSAVFAFTYAAFQPVIGAVGDLFGKARVMVACLAMLGLINLLGAFAGSFALLFATRVVAGVFAGGVLPIMLSLTSDLIESDSRQVAIGRTLAGAMAGNLLGASAAGLIGDWLGWRGVLVVLGALAMAAAAAVTVGFRGVGLQKSSRATFAVLRSGYRTIFANPNAPATYFAVFIGGSCVFGLFPFIAAFLRELGQSSLAIAGIVIAGFAVGGLIYSTMVGWLLARLGMKRMMIIGALLAASQFVIVALGPRWEVQTFNLIVLGLGFYMIHGCFQIFASELSVSARASALSLHSFFFFMGQSIGPILYGVGLHQLGKVATLSTGAAVMVVLGLASAYYLKQRPPADARSG